MLGCSPGSTEFSPLFIVRLNSDVTSILSGDPVELIISFVGKSLVGIIPICIPAFESKEYVLYGC